ncbi:unnamed protein product, partial [Owenia fusiformis]
MARFVVLACVLLAVTIEALSTDQQNGKVMVNYKWLKDLRKRNFDSIDGSSSFAKKSFDSINGDAGFVKKSFDSINGDAGFAKKSFDSINGDAGFAKKSFDS